MSMPSWNISRPVQHVPNVDFFHCSMPRCAPGIRGVYNANFGGTLKKNLCPHHQNRVGAYGVRHARSKGAEPRRPEKWDLLLRAYCMGNSNQILHGDQTRCEENFYRVWITNADERSLS